MPNIFSSNQTELNSKPEYSGSTVVRLGTTRQYHRRFWFRRTASALATRREWNITISFTRVQPGRFFTEFPWCFNFNQHLVRRCSTHSPLNGGNLFASTLSALSAIIYACGTPQQKCFYHLFIYLLAWFGQRLDVIITMLEEDKRQRRITRGMKKASAFLSHRE